MSNRIDIATLVVMLVALASPSSLGAQPADSEAVLGAPHGQPDISGIFTFRTLTRLERPAALEGKETLDAEEAEAFEASENTRLNRDLFDPIKGAPSAGYAPRSEGGVLSYNEFWYERGVELTKDKRTSLIVDPPDGRIPWTEEGLDRRRQRRERRRESPADTYTDRSLSDRCIMGFNSGPPMTSGAYNNNVQIFQAPGFVAILNEMVHNVRIIPLDGRPSPKLPQYAGTSRGRWEGETLIVETSDFLRETSLRGSGANTHLVERFRRIDPDTVMYEFTVDDPTTYSRPWTAMMPLRRTDGPLYEYACHEGNYAMAGILGGARLLEKAAAESQTEEGE